MYKLTFLLFALTYSLIARENPFFPLNSDLDIPLTTNQTQSVPKLKRAALSLPSTARQIESVTVKYKNLDGSIDTKSIELQNCIDWHIPIFISQNYNLSSEKESKKKTQPVVKLKKKTKFTKFTSLKFISFYTNEKVMKIKTKDEMIRSFLLTKPHRIVCDFKRATDIRSFEKISSKKRIFKKINIGTHSGYYRVVIELDGFYKYSIKKSTDGYIISLT